jgi:ABC-2 type transport system permease protein
VRQLWQSRDLIGNLTLREIRSNYRRTILGQTWSLLNPIALLAIYSFVFSYVLQIRVAPGSQSGLDTFALWLAAALLPYLFVSSAVPSGLSSLVANTELIQKVHFPRETLVIAAVLSALFTFMIEMFVLHVAVVIFGGTLAPIRILVTLCLIALLFVFILGIALVASVINVYFRDTQHLVSIFLMAWLYASPIIYPITLVSDRLGAGSRGFQIYQLNPLTRFVEAFRDILYDGHLPTGSTIVYLVAVSFAVLSVGHVVFRSLEGSLAEEL